jgi:hypothetical protein
VITDGQDRASFYKLEHLEKLVGKTAMPIFFIQLGELVPKEKQKAENLINYLALRTGGTVFPISKRSTFGSEVESIAHQLHAPYVVTYTSSNPLWDGSTRKLRVEVNGNPSGEAMVVATSPGYTVPKKLANAH